MCKKLRGLSGLTADEILSRANVESYPVDIKAVIKKLGITTKPFDFSALEKEIPEIISKRGPILGAVTVINDDINIFYSENSTENRERFTLAHELAHCCLNAHNLTEGHIEFRFDELTKDPNEIAANIFAGQLLIPEGYLREIYDSLIVPASDVLANEFQVSVPVMEARLTQLKLGYYSPKNFGN